MITKGKNLAALMILSALAGLLMICSSPVWAESATDQETNVTAAAPSTTDEDDESLLVPKRGTRGGGFRAPGRSSPRFSRPAPRPVQRFSRPASRPVQRFSRPSPRHSMPRYTRHSQPSGHRMVRPRPAHQRIVRPSQTRHQPSVRTQHHKPPSIARPADHYRRQHSGTRPPISDVRVRPNQPPVHRPTTPPISGRRLPVSPNETHHRPGGFIAQRPTSPSDFGNRPTGNHSGPATLPPGFSHIGHSPNHGLQNHPPTVSGARPNVVTSGNRAITSRPQAPGSLGNSITSGSQSRQDFAHGARTGPNNGAQKPQTGIGNSVQNVKPDRGSFVRTAPLTSGSTSRTVHDGVGNGALTGQNAVSTKPPTVQHGGTHGETRIGRLGPQRTGTGAPGGKPQTPNKVSTVKPGNVTPGGKPDKPNTVSPGNRGTRHNPECRGRDCHKPPPPPCRGPHCRPKPPECRGPHCPKPTPRANINNNYNIARNFTPLPVIVPGGDINIEINPGGGAGEVAEPPESDSNGPVIIERDRGPAGPPPQPAAPPGPSPDDLINQGISEFSQGNYDTAEKRFMLALDILRGAKDSNPAVIASALENLAHVYDQVGKVREAAEARENARRIRERA